MHRVCRISIALLLVAGCADTRGRNVDGGTSTPPPGTDGSTPPPPPPGALTLAVEGAAFQGSNLIARVRVGNGAGAESVSLAPSNFALALAGGAELTASSSAGGFLPSPCRAELSVGPSGTVACELVFAGVAGAPEQIHYRPGERAASAPVARCSAAAPAGLCDAGRVCEGGVCVEPCGPSAPRGVCPTPGELCVEGYCELRCSPSSPYGPCEVGVCRSGACDASCRTIAFGDECFSCLSPLIGGEDPTCAVEERCQDCAYCTLERSDCECLDEEGYCTGCEATLRASLDCILARCPSCVR
ncbi:MAG: hypothetical protein KF729_33390 [Sandaracinaceae bacterium]|nr:hypothetical protein [Sandaracinaceae bacterium]